MKVDVNLSKSKTKVVSVSPVKIASIPKNDKSKKAEIKNKTLPVPDPPKVDAKSKKRDAPSVDKKDVSVADDKKLKKTKSDEQIVKVITKGGAAVDSFV